MPWIYYNVFLYLLTAATTTGELNLTIVKNEGGIKIPVGPVLKTSSGANLSLICKTVDAEDGKLMHDNIIWGRKKKNLKLTENELINGVSLNFTSLSVKDQGEYFCVSLKYKLATVIFIAVRPKFSLFGAGKETNNLKNSLVRSKRSVNNYGDSEIVAETGLDMSDFPSQNLNRGTRDDDWDLWHFKTEEEKQREEEEARRRKEKKEAAARRKKYVKTAFIIVAIVLGAATLLYILYKCMAGNDFRTGRDSQHIDNLISENRLLNERVRRLCAERNNARVAHNNNNDDNVESHLVRPQSPTNSVPNSHQINRVASSNKTVGDLPPPYEEAVATVAPSAPPCDDDVSPNVPLKG